ncbi:hypothetical protein CC2G_000601 [Coprinopsis cinerea AmutBmut pab1-1]|nr:hypothetical protein CC2G_000601 [Coprinopsis cinerea AmutBmut pab1-1]
MATPNHKIPPTHEKTLLQSYATLPPRTRMKIALAMCAVGGIGLVVSDYLEKKLPPPEKSSQK